MGNDEERRANNSSHRQQYTNQLHPTPSNQIYQQQRSGLLPTDEQDAYKRSANRTSRRSRAERTSYLMATGHLDPEETQHLNGPIQDTILTEPANTTTTPSTSNTALLQRDISDQQQLSQGLRVSTKRSNFEQSFLDDLNRTLANSPVASQNLHYQQHRDLRSSHNTSGSSRKSGGDSSRKSKKQSPTSKSGSYSKSTENDGSARGKFRQTYTEVTLPMKTSPAFEYILKDNRRRNKRCCLWLLYATLMSICLLIIIWALVMLSRSAHKH
jgi:hypothetical protein